MSIWDDPQLQVSNNFIKFENVGDTVAGSITSVSIHRWLDDSTSPKVTMVTPDGEEKVLTAGQYRLKAALAEERPEVGDFITITLTGVEKLAGGKTLKVFDVKVDRGGGAQAGTAGAGAPAAAVTPAPASAPVPASAAPAAVDNLSAEQRAALNFSGA